MFERLDADHDGRVSRAEYKASIDARFDKLDANGDGSVDADEIARSPATAERVNRRAERFVQRYDASGTGKVTRSDFEAKEMARFERLGAGADSVTQEQLSRQRMHRGAPEAASKD
jgi:Ca2+-binding EF-hand superfamily protein